MLVKNNSSMKKLESGRTEYQEFLYSLFIKYGIDSPDELWSNSVWKVIVDNRVSNYARENFYKELSEFNIKNPSDENWTHTSDKKLEEIKTKDENDEIREKTNAEFIRRKIKETQINIKGKENLEEVESLEEIEEKKKREKSARHLASNSEVKIAYAIGKEKRIAAAKKASEERTARFAAKKAEEESALLIKELEKEEEKRIAAAKKVEEEKRIAAKKVEEESALLIKELEKEKEEEKRIAAAKKVEEEKNILYALKVEEDKVPKKEEFHTEDIKYGELKKCPYCAEDINIAAIKCKHCGEIFDIEKISRNTYDVASATLIKNQSSPKDQRHTNTIVVRENNNGCLTILLIFICCFLIGYFILGPLAIFGLIVAFLNSF